MTATADDLARRLVESPHWRWLPGCLYLRPETRIASGVLPYLTRRGRYEDYEMWGLPRGTVPIIGEADPATEGCLLRLAREAWAPRGGRVHVGTSSVAVFGRGRDPQWWDGPLGLALAHAILAAGEVRDA